MNKEQTLEAIKVMQTWCDGEDVDYALLADDPADRRWINVEADKYHNGEPVWNFQTNVYRIAPQKPSINWDHVAPRFICMFMHSSGAHELCEKVPEKGQPTWNVGYVDYVSAEVLSSFKPGNVPWDESLVMRPGYEGE